MKNLEELQAKANELWDLANIARMTADFAPITEFEEAKKLADDALIAAVEASQAAEAAWREACLIK